MNCCSVVLTTAPQCSGLFTSQYEAFVIIILSIFIVFYQRLRFKSSIEYEKKKSANKFDAELFQTVLTRNQGTTDDWAKRFGSVSRTTPINCTEKIPFLTDYKVS